MSRVTVIIPSRNEPLLRQTVDDLLAKATGDIEVIAVLDGCNALSPLPNDARLRIIQWGHTKGLRPSINAAAAIATGDYLMKIDSHCAICEGYDEILQKDCEPNWIVVPSKFSLDPITWTRFKPPWNYFYLTFPYDPILEHIGLHDKNFGPSMNHARRDVMIDDVVSFQGSCWFIPKTLFEKFGPMDAEHYYYAQEPQELGLKAWLSGGRVVVNKNAWYAHLHKGRAHGRGFPRYKGQWKRAIQWSANYWMTNSWPGRVYDMKWLVEKFWYELHNAPSCPWPDDWDNPKYKAYWDNRG